MGNVSIDIPAIACALRVANRGSKSTKASNEAQRRMHAQTRKALTLPVDAPSQPELDSLFESLRSGAANVAGVTFQTAVGTYLLARGRADTSSAKIIEVRPEGFEDLDCRLSDGTWVYVQCKERSGKRNFALAEVAEALAHASRIDRAAGSEKRAPAAFAIVTNSSLDTRIPATGWDAFLDPLALPELVAKLTRLLANSEQAVSVISRTHTIAEVEHLRSMSEKLIEAAVAAHPAIVSIAAAQISEAVTHASAEQRSRSLEESISIPVSIIDAIIESLNADVDTNRLDLARRRGICELVDFTLRSPDSPTQFYLGVSVLPSHIADRVDVVRTDECVRLLSELQASRHVTIVGPSGSGKSALLWRAAALVDDGPRIVHVRRVATDEDALGLVDYVRQLRPKPGREILVCADDLGHIQLASWPLARDRLLEMLGVRVLAACRMEDLSPALASNATLFDARLTDSSARRIYERLSAIGLPLAIEPEEAGERAEGLLMEFIALATTGRRLEQVLATQVAGLRDKKQFVAIDALAAVTAAHVLGRSLRSSELEHMLSASRHEIATAMASLHDEHLVVSDDQSSWRALHDLRAATVLRVIHRTPFPTLAATFATVISAMPREERPRLVRRAATLVVGAVDFQPSTDMENLLAVMSEALRPLSECVVSELVSNEPSSRLLVAPLLETADGLDAVAYAAATLPWVASHKVENSPASQLHLLLFTARFNGAFENNRLFATIRSLSAELPDWNGSAGSAARAALSSTLIAETLIGLPIQAAVRLAEAAEGAVSMTTEQVAAIWRAQQPEGTSSIRDADYLARLTASISVALEGGLKAASSALGPVELRVQRAVAVDPSGLLARVETVPIEELPIESNPKVSTRSISGDGFLMVTAHALVKYPFELPIEHGYRPLPGDREPLNEQAVMLARRLFDTCPEVDVVRVEILYPNMSTRGHGTVDRGLKIFRAGALPRDVGTRRTNAVTAAIAELSSAALWSERCRRQAELSKELVRLLKATPSRLSRSDNKSKARQWQADVERAAVQVADLPGMPIQAWGTSVIDQSETAYDLDAHLRDASQDPARHALGVISSGLLSVARNKLVTSRTQAGLRLSTAPELLSIARDASAMPYYEGVGDVMPGELDVLSRSIARLLTSPMREVIAQRTVRPDLDFSDLDQRLLAIAQSEAAASYLALSQRLVAFGVDSLRVAYHEPVKPTAPHLFVEVAVSVPHDQWDASSAALQSWTDEERASEGFRIRTMLLGRQGDFVATGLVVPPQGRAVLPAASLVVEASAALHLRASEHRHQDALQEYTDRLLEISVAKVRHVARERSLHPRGLDASTAELEGEVRRALESARSPSWRGALEHFLKLIELVAEVGGDPDGFAAAFSSISPYPPFGTQDNASLEALGLAWASAAESDRED